MSKLRRVLLTATAIVALAAGAANAKPAATTSPGGETVTVGTDATWTVDGSQPAAEVTCFNWWGAHSDLVAAGAKWIGNNSCPSGYTTHTFTKTFDLGVVESGTLSFTADNTATAIVNGVNVGANAVWETVATVDITSALTSGTNTISIVASNQGGPGGLLALLDITHTPLRAPATKDDCKNGGWGSFNNPAFTNQGDCVSFVATGGK